MKDNCCFTEIEIQNINGKGLLGITIDRGLIFDSHFKEYQ